MTRSKKGSPIPKHVECTVCGKNSRSFIRTNRDRVLKNSGWVLTENGWVCADKSCRKALAEPRADS